MDKFICLKKQENYAFHVILFLFIVTVNVIMLLLSKPLERIGYRGWVFYMVSVLYFMFPEKNLVARSVKLGVGGMTGCLMAYVVIRLYMGSLVGLGEWGLIIPIVICLALLFLAGPFIPFCFNNSAFAYFTVSFVKAEEAVTNLGANLIFILIGTLILCGGYTVILKLYFGRKITKKETE